MVYNAMYPIRQNPYSTAGNRNFVKKKEDEESSKSAYSQENQENQTHSANQTNPIKLNDNRTFYEQKVQESKDAQELAKSSLEENIKNATINIAQIIKDFRSTALAIGTPDELNEEVEGYIALVEAQVIKENPNAKVVKSNLKNAASLLDGYITETLQRPSQVVENWLDALFLQKINYKHNEEQVNEQFLVKFPEGKNPNASEKNEPQTKLSSQSTTKSNVVVPNDEQLKSLFIQAKKFSYANEPQKAIETFQQALSRASEVEDKETQSKIFFEIGKIYDNSDYLTQALSSYNKSISSTQDDNIKTKAHFSMAKIYDDVAQFTPAIEHYISSIAYAGEAENLTAQSTSLTKIGNIFSDKYDKEAFNYYSEADLIAAESQNSKVKGYVSSSIASAHTKFNEPEIALKYYSQAIKEYKEAESPLKMAINYQKAALVMEEFGNSAKAQNLLKKALECAQKSEDKALVAEISGQLKG